MIAHPPLTLNCEADLERGVATLCRIDPRFEPIRLRVGTPALRRAEAGFGTLVRIIIEQSISLKAASAVHGRLVATIKPFDPVNLERTSLSTLRRAGLTRGKSSAIQSLAKALIDGSLDLRAVTEMNDAEAVTTLTRLPGIGPWTANIYLLSVLGRADIWPSSDVALRVALGDLFATAGRPSLEAMEAMAEPWRPWRTVAALLLWAHYRTLRSMPQAC
jgi:DNA-3-methyladenine glycosylase II